jgi:hypothetical protein
MYLSTSAVNSPHDLFLNSFREPSPLHQAHVRFPEPEHQMQLHFPPFPEPSFSRSMRNAASKAARAASAPDPDAEF